MKVEIKTYICEILNRCWNNAIEISNIDVSKEDMDELCCFIKSNRIEGYLYRVLKNKRENNTLFWYCESLYEENLKVYDKTIEEIKYVAECFGKVKDTYAMVNGSYAIPFVCRPGERIQKDIDICVSRQGYEKIHKELVNHGFSQAIIDGNKIREASRIETIVAFRNNKYVIPYYKKCQNEKIRNLWIDIDVCELDDEDFSILLEKRALSEKLEIYCFDVETNIVYVCKTIYTRVKTYRYMKAKQDYVLFYFCQLNQIIMDNYDIISWEKVEQRSKIMKSVRAVYYSVSILLELFGISYSDLQRNRLGDLVCNLKEPDFSFMNHVYDEKELKEYVYECSDTDYLFHLKREELLKENNRKERILE